jgi:hypothetical protein
LQDLVWNDLNQICKRYERKDKIEKEKWKRNRKRRKGRRGPIWPNLYFGHGPSRVITRRGIRRPLLLPPTGGSHLLGPSSSPGRTRCLSAVRSSWAPNPSPYPTTSSAYKSLVDAPLVPFSPSPEDFPTPGNSSSESATSAAVSACFRRNRWAWAPPSCPILFYSSRCALWCSLFFQLRSRTMPTISPEGHRRLSRSSCLPLPRQDAIDVEEHVSEPAVTSRTSSCRRRWPEVARTSPSVEPEPSSPEISRQWPITLTLAGELLFKSQPYDLDPKVPDNSLNQTATGRSGASRSI